MPEETTSSAFGIVIQNPGLLWPMGKVTHSHLQFVIQPEAQITSTTGLHHRFTMVRRLPTILA